MTQPKNGDDAPGETGIRLTGVGRLDSVGSREVVDILISAVEATCAFDRRRRGVSPAKSCPVFQERPPWR
jgi:hypothetical protein